METIGRVREYLQGKKTLFTVVVGMLYVVGVWAGVFAWDEKVALVLGLGSIAFLRLGLKSGGGGQALLWLAGAGLGLALLAGAGCRNLDAGADPIVVNAERTATVAKGTFDLVLAVDHADRGFWRTNAPAFHHFCEWLRAPVPVYGTNRLPRCSAMLWSLEEVKGDYKVARLDGSALLAAITGVQSALQEARALLTLVGTNAAPGR